MDARKMISMCESCTKIWLVKRGPASRQSGFELFRKFDRYWPKDLQFGSFVELPTPYRHAKNCRAG